MAGGMTFATLSDIAKKWCARFPKSVTQAWQVDCQQGTKIDSCGLAFLLACRRHAKTHDIVLHISGIEAVAAALMQAHGVASVLIEKQ